MSKTRRNIGAAHRHIKDGESINDHRIDRYTKKLEGKAKSRKTFSDDEDFGREINHKNYGDFIDDDDSLVDYTDDDLSLT